MLEKLYHLYYYAQEHGHCVLRLPPYNCHFNAIEMVLSECKRKYDESIPKTNASPVDVLKTWENVKNQVLNIHWENYIKHTEKIIDSAWQTEKILDHCKTNQM